MQFLFDYLIQLHSNILHYSLHLVLYFQFQHNIYQLDKLNKKQELFVLEQHCMYLLGKE